MVEAVNLSRDAFFENYLFVIPEYKIQVFADMVDAKAINPPINNLPRGGIKRPMRGLSAQSRHAMIEFLAKVEEVPQLFVTLTYSDDIAAQWYFHCRDDFELMRKRMEYHHKGIRAMWRLEFVPRKSGRYLSQFIPHFHLLIWLPPTMNYEEKEAIMKDNGQMWRNWWHSITHSQDINHKAHFGCKVEPIRSRRHAYAYCSKYLAKDHVDDIEFGRRWGRIGKFEQPVDIETELTYPEYKHFKRLLNAYIKAESYKRWKNQKLRIPYPATPLSDYRKFYNFFRRMNVNTGSSVLGLGFMSQEKPIGMRTILKIIRHARELATNELVERYAKRSA